MSISGANFSCEVRCRGGNRSHRNEKASGAHLWALKRAGADLNSNRSGFWFFCGCCPTAHLVSLYIIPALCWVNEKFFGGVVLSRGLYGTSGLVSAKNAWFALGRALWLVAWCAFGLCVLCVFVWVCASLMYVCAVLLPQPTAHRKRQGTRQQYADNYTQTHNPSDGLR